MRQLFQQMFMQKEQPIRHQRWLLCRLQILLPAVWSRGLTAHRTVVSTALLFALVLSPAFAAAQIQTGTLRGTANAVNPQGQPIPLGGVAIKLTANAPGLPPQTAYSNEKGEFELDNVPAGPYTLEVSVQGFKPVTRKITITAGQTLTQDIQMQLQEFKQNVEVKESAPIVSTQGTSPAAQTLETKQLLTIPVVRQEFKQELPVTPGVLQVQSGKLFIKGVPESQSMLLLDSTQAVDPVTGTYSIDVPIDAIQSLDVFKAPFG